jgi:hypothetical protein
VSVVFAATSVPMIVFGASLGDEMKPCLGSAGLALVRKPPVDVGVAPKSARMSAPAPVRTGSARR